MINYESSESQIPPGAVFTTDEAAQILKVNPRTIKRMVKIGKLRVAEIMSAIRIPRAEIVRVISTPRTLGLLQRLESKNLGFNHVDVIYGAIPEPDPREILGFLVSQKRIDLILSHSRYLPLGGWLRKKSAISDEDAMHWAYLRFAALKISTLHRLRRKALKKTGDDPHQVIRVFALASK